MIPPREIRTARLLAAAAVVAGLSAWAVYLNEGLVLSHYDAKAHLVVARRVVDSLTPGWQQIGAVWLPLPHLIHLLPTQVDLLYRTGAFASLVSVFCFGVTIYAAARLVLSITHSHLAAAISSALLALNPNLLYLQATPMTEPLLVAATFLLVLWLYEWLQADTDRVPARLGWTFFAAAWTRYEAWLIVCAALAAAVYVMLRRRTSLSTVVRRTARLAAWPLVAVLIFFVNSRITVGSWFVAAGFYVPDPTYQGQLQRTVLGIWWGTHRLSGYVIEIVALLTAASLLVWSMVRSNRAALVVPVALVAAAALPFYAFFEGHPFRIRYMVPLAAACSLFAGLAVGLVSLRENTWTTAGRRLSPLAIILAVVLLQSAIVESPPWSRHAPMIEEAQWDVPRSLERRGVTACLTSRYHGEKVLASMASLAHYMQELSSDGFALADFIHEGNGTIWDLALETGPAPHAGWMLVEEQAEGGDVLAERVRHDPAFIQGMTRVCEGGGVALYARAAGSQATPVVRNDPPGVARHPAR